jgi:hypothetical protein
MSTLRIEFIKASEPKNGVPNAAAASRVLSESELAITGVATIVGSQPAAPAEASHAVLFAVGSAAYVDFDGHKGMSAGVAIAADPTTVKRFYVPAGQSRIITGFATGAKFSAITSSIS